MVVPREGDEGSLQELEIAWMSACLNVLHPKVVHISPTLSAPGTIWNVRTQLCSNLVCASDDQLPPYVVFVGKKQ